LEVELGELLAAIAAEVCANMKMAVMTANAVRNKKLGICKLYMALVFITPPVVVIRKSNTTSKKETMYKMSNVKKKHLAFADSYFGWWLSRLKIYRMGFEDLIRNLRGFIKGVANHYRMKKYGVVSLNRFFNKSRIHSTFDAH
jgi:hypothetical protein